MWVFIAGPYTGGDVIQNVRASVAMGVRLRDAGHVPIIPHLFHFVHYLFPRDYRFWTSWDKALLERCDVLVRLPGESPGADAEIVRAEERGIKVLYVWETDAPERVVDALRALAHERANGK
jgi:hypothetical protein